jgi:Molecular chaperone (small heat shock protein)
MYVKQRKEVAMAIIRFDPFRSFESLARRMSEMFEDFEKGITVTPSDFSPRVDISEDEKHLYVTVEIPGVNKDDVKVTINDDNILVIKGEKKREFKTEYKERNFIRVERSYGSFQRSFMLPDNFKKDNVSAKFENGVLTITLEKIEPEPPKQIEIPIS